MADIAVAHLVRKGNEIDWFKAFINSYQHHVAGVAHELIIIFKGFDEELDTAELACYDSLLNGLSYQSCFVTDDGFDIGAYFKTARRLDFKYFCFLNSHSVILDANWLAKMYQHILAPKVGIVGATGSYESHCGPRLHEPHFLRRNLIGHIIWDYIMSKRFGEYGARFNLFPNPHLRTNAFLIACDLMLSLQVGSLKTKLDAYTFESGRRGLTRQVIRKGLQPVVVGRDGKAYSIESWWESRTFRQGQQENLLVEDNHTRQYAAASPEAQKAVAESTWG